MANSKRGISRWFILAVNIICALMLVGLFVFYNRIYQQNIQQQNLNNISNLNQSSGELSIKFFESQKKSLLNISQYVSHNKMTQQELLNFLSDLNADEDCAYELVAGDYTGFYAKREEDESYTEVDYTSKDYKALHSILDDGTAEMLQVVRFAPEFTDGYNARKCFALCTVVPVYEAGDQPIYYTLMAVSYSDDFVDMIQVTGEYKAMTSVLFDDSGYYIISNADFKSENFFQYIYSCNQLTLDEKKALADRVFADESGTIFYRNSLHQDCVYAYNSLYNGKWYIVSCVPLTSFKQMSVDYRFTLLVVLLIFLIFAVDFMWLAKLNRHLAMSVEKEKRANSAKTDFLSRMSHDIRTPLNAVIGFSDMAGETEGLPDETKDYLGKIHSSGQYLLGLINDILDMSKIESNKIELHETLVNGPVFLKEIVDVFSAQAEQKGIVLKTDFVHAQTPWIYMDALRSRQIYSNLLNNAIKFSDAGTTITWTITDTPIDENRIRMVAVIADQGCGMSDAFMQHIFHPFEQEHNSHSDKEGGTGLGLSIVKSLVEVMGGTVEVWSEVGKGSTFTITMERRVGDAKEAVVAKEASSVDWSILKDKRVLLCEDHPMNVEIAVRLLKKQGMLVETAENGQVGLDLFNASTMHYYDLVLMDIRMPVMNGLEAAKAIRQLSRGDAKVVPIIAMTANAFDDDIQNCRDAGMNGHLAKPINPELLYDTIAEAVNKKRVEEP